MPAIIATLITMLQDEIIEYVPHNETVPESVVESSRSLLHSSEAPDESITGTIYAETDLLTSTRALVHLKIFDALAAATASQTATQLARDARADPKLVERLLKRVALEGFVDETADEYVASDLTRVLATAR